MRLTDMDYGIDEPMLKLAAAELMLKFSYDKDAQQVVLELLQSNDEALMLMAARVFELNKSHMPDVIKQIDTTINEKTH